MIVDKFVPNMVMVTHVRIDISGVHKEYNLCGK